MDNTKENYRVYEVSFLLVPSLSLEKSKEEVAKYREFVTKNGGEIISEDAPKMRNLAYEIIKAIGGVNRRFNEAYFAWIKFEIDPEHLVALKKNIEKNESVMRHMIIQTVRENTFLGEDAKSVIAENVISLTENEESHKDEGVKIKEEPVKEKATEEEIDKSIDDMVKEV